MKTKIRSSGSKKIQEEYTPVNFSFIEYINTLNCCTSLEMRVAGILGIIVLSLIVVSFGLSSAFAAEMPSGTIPPLSIKTELPLYEDGDSVVFSGLIKDPDANNSIDITIRVLGPLINGTSKQIVTVKQIHPAAGSFEGTFVVSGPLWKAAGDYKIIVNYGPQKAETTFRYSGGTGVGIIDVPPPKLTTCPEGQSVVNGQCVTAVTPPPVEKPKCGTGTVLDETTGTCVVAPTITCPPGQILSSGQCIDQPPVETPTCGTGTHAENGICVPDKKPVSAEKKGCLIATAAYGSELAPQVQLLREVRDNVLFSTSSGTSFMSAFNAFYYSFSPTVADWERQSPVFKEAVKVTITPMLSTLSILNYVHIGSESEMLGYGIGIMLLNIGMYFVAPALVIVKLNDLRKKRGL
jgi:hypothetical protein